MTPAESVTLLGAWTALVGVLTKAVVDHRTARTGERNAIHAEAEGIWDDAKALRVELRADLARAQEQIRLLTERVADLEEAHRMDQGTIARLERQLCARETCERREAVKA